MLARISRETATKWDEELLKAKLMIIRFVLLTRAGLQTGVTGKLQSEGERKGVGAGDRP